MPTNYRENNIINKELKLWKPETPVLHINSAAYTPIAFLNCWVFDVIVSSTSSLKILKLVMAEHRPYS